MNNLQKILGIGALLISLAGCKEYRYESILKQEKATVIDKKYSPKISFKIEGIKITIPETYNTLFDGTVDFTVNNKEIYNQFNKGDSAEIKYNECWEYIYADKELKELTNSRIYVYKFVNAVKK